jgi:hypothetical protein
VAPYAAILTAAVAGQAPPPSAWHGWLYRSLGEPGNEYHRTGTPPFSLRPAPSWNRVRVVLLDGSLADAMDLKPGSEGPKGLLLTEVEWDLCPYQQFMETGQDWPGEVSLEFLTPVAFRQGPYTMLVPLPGLAFGGLKRLWDRFVAIDLQDPGREELERHVEISWLSLTTRRFDIGLGVYRGAVGQLTYRFGDVAWGNSLRTLAAFAELAGVGMKRAFGMGGVRRIPRRPQKGRADGDGGGARVCEAKPGSP